MLNLSLLATTFSFDYISRVDDFVRIITKANKKEQGTCSFKDGVEPFVV